MPNPQRFFKILWWGFADGVTLEQCRALAVFGLGFPTPGITNRHGANGARVNGLLWMVKAGQQGMNYRRHPLRDGSQRAANLQRAAATE